MPVITRLVATKSGKSIHVYLDNQLTFSLSPNEVIRHKLDKGISVSNNKLRLLKQSSDYEKNYLKALNLISYRPRSSHEITKYLKRHSVSPKVISKITANLKRQGYLNDPDFALTYANSKARFRHHGPRRIRAELSSKGIPAAEINHILTLIFPDQTSLLEQAQKALLKKNKTFHSLSATRFRQKASSYLFRLGFDYQTISQLLKAPQIVHEHDTPIDE